MLKQNINIVGIPILYNILEEIKHNLSFRMENYNKLNDFENFLNEKKLFNNIIIITEFKNKDFLLKKKIQLKNIFFFCKKNFQNNDFENCNIIQYPINIYNFIEKINIQLIKHEYDFKSNVKVKNYFIDLNSKIISKENKSLKLTEKEIEIILFLKDQKKPQNILKLQKEVWGYSDDIETHTVETHVYRLRKKLKDTFLDDNFLKSLKEGYKI